MDWYKKIDSLITHAIEKVITVFFMIILGLVFFLVVLRYVFSSSIMGANEVVTMLFIYCSALGTAVMVRDREHIKISFFIEKLPIGAKKIVLTINYLLIGTLNVFFTYLSLGWIESTLSFKSQITNIPFWVVELAIPIGCGLVVFYCLSNILLIHTDKNAINAYEIDMDLKDALEQVDEIKKHGGE